MFNSTVSKIHFTSHNFSEAMVCGFTNRLVFATMHEAHDIQNMSGQVISHLEKHAKLQANYKDVNMATFIESRQVKDLRLAKRSKNNQIITAKNTMVEVTHKVNNGRVPVIDVSVYNAWLRLAKAAKAPAYEIRESSQFIYLVVENNQSIVSLTIPKQLSK